MEGMEGVDRLEVDRREKQALIYAIGGNKIMKADTNWNPMWVVDVGKK